MSYEKFNFSSKMQFFIRPWTRHNCLKYLSSNNETSIIRRAIKFYTQENLAKSKRMFKLYAFFNLRPKFLDLSFSVKIKTSSPAPPYYSSSLYILGIYALRVNTGTSRFTRFAASAERNCILKVPGGSFSSVLALILQILEISFFDQF